MMTDCESRPQQVGEILVQVINFNLLESKQTDLQTYLNTRKWQKINVKNDS